MTLYDGSILKNTGNKYKLQLDKTMNDFPQIFLIR